MTEAETRKIIDEQLCKVGWEADTDNLRYSKGTRPHIIIDHTARYFFYNYHAVSCLNRLIGEIKKRLGNRCLFDNEWNCDR